MSDKVGKSNTSASGPYMGTRARKQTSKHADTSLGPGAGPKSLTKTSAETSVEPSSRSIRRKKKAKGKRQSSSKSNIELATTNVTSAINPAITTVASTAVATSTTSSSIIGLGRADTASLEKARTSTEAEATTSAAEAAVTPKATATTSAAASHIENKNAGRTTKTSTEAGPTTSTAEAAGTSKATATTSTGASHESKNTGRTNPTADKPYKSRLNYRKSKNKPENMHIMAYLAKLKLENAPDDVMRLEVANYFHDYNIKNITKPTLGFPLSKADIYRNTMAFNSARSYAHHIYTLEEAIQYRELHEAGLIDREIPASVLDEEYPNTSDDEETETWADVVEELRQQERQRRFEEMNAPHPALEREVPLDPASLVEEEDAGYFCA